MEIVNKINYSDNKIVIEIDSDFNINKRYKKPLSKWLRRSLLATLIIGDENPDISYSMVLGVTKTSIKIVFYAKDAITGDEHVCLKSSVNRACCSPEAIDILQQYQLQNVLKFKISFNNITLAYFCCFEAIKKTYVELNGECCVCFESGKLGCENGFFKCGHIEICDGCYNRLSAKKCPICRSI